MLLKTKYTHREQNKNIHVSKRSSGITRLMRIDLLEEQSSGPIDGDKA